MRIHRGLLKFAACSLGILMATVPATAHPKRHGHAPARLSHFSHQQVSPGIFTDASGNPLVAEARKYIGGNPTGRRSLWCGAFMDLILRRSGYRGGGNLALGYEHYGRRVAGPVVGAIAVMGRRGRAAGGSRGGHVGVVAGIDPNGNPILISGNHNHTVAEAVYPRSRIAAYVLPEH